MRRAGATCEFDRELLWGKTGGKIGGSRNPSKNDDRHQSDAHCSVSWASFHSLAIWALVSGRVRSLPLAKLPSSKILEQLIGCKEDEEVIRPGSPLGVWCFAKPQCDPV